MIQETFYQDHPSLNESQSITVKEKHIIEDSNFQKLIHIQEEIYNITQVKPSLKKLVNLIIEQSDLTSIRDQLIKQYQ